MTQKQGHFRYKTRRAIQMKPLQNHPPKQKQRKSIKQTNKQRKTKENKEKHTTNKQPQRRKKTKKQNNPSANTTTTPPTPRLLPKEEPAPPKPSDGWRIPRHGRRSRAAGRGAIDPYTSWPSADGFSANKKPKESKIKHKNGGFGEVSGVWGRFREFGEGLGRFGEVWGGRFGEVWGGVFLGRLFEDDVFLLTPPPNICG